MSKIVPPDGMVWAIKNEMDMVGLSMPSEEYARRVANAVCFWISEYPVTPSLPEVKEFHSPEMLQLSYHGQLQEACVRWQRRMFLAPDPEVPEEIKDLLIYSGTEGERLTEAFRRGQASTRGK